MGSRGLHFAASPSQQAEKVVSPFSNNEEGQLHSSNLYKGLSPPLTKRWFYPGQATKAGDLGGNSERKRRGRSGVEEWSTHQTHDLKTAGSNPVPA